MAYESVIQETTYAKATALAEGQSFEGYYLYEEINERGYLNFIFESTNGQKIYFSPAGNLKYLTSNGTPLIPGLLTRITRNGQRTNKKGQVVGVYKVEQDRTNMTPRFSPEQLAAMNQKDPAVAAVQAMRG